MAKKAKRSDGRYQVKASLGYDENGKRIQKIFYGSTQKEAMEKKNAYLESIKQPTIDSDITVAEWAEKWLSAYASGGYSSQQNHKSNVKKIVEAMGKMRVADVKQVDIKSFAKKYEGHSKSFVAKLRYDTQNIFKTARQNNLITSNPCDDVKWENAGEGSHRAIEDWERKLITDYWFVSNAGTWAMLMLYAGMRPGEALSLKWKHISEDSITITDARHFEAGQPVFTEGKTKTKAGQRIVPIVPPLAPLLRARGADDDFVCKSATGKPITKSAYRKNWDSFMNRLENVLNGRDHAALGVRKDIIEGWKKMPEIHPYDLRHTYCSMLYDAGVDVKTAQYLMGHATLEVTLKIYTHLSEQKKERAYDKLIDFLS